MLSVVLFLLELGSWRCFFSWGFVFFPVVSLSLGSRISPLDNVSTLISPINLINQKANIPNNPNIPDIANDPIASGSAPDPFFLSPGFFLRIFLEDFSFPVNLASGAGSLLSPAGSAPQTPTRTGEIYTHIHINIITT